MKSGDVLLAKLDGAVKAQIATVRCGKKYFVVAPPTLGGTREVPADSLTDCLHSTVHSMGAQIAKERRKKA